MGISWGLHRFGVRSAGLVLTVALASLVGCGGREGGAAAEPTANGIEKMSPAQAVTAGRDALLAAKTVHLKGDAGDSTQHYEVDVRLSQGGSTGTVTSDGQAMTVLAVGDRAWVKGSESVYEEFAGEGSYARLRGKWLERSLDDLGAVTPFVNREYLAFSVLSAEVAEDLTAAGRTDVGGKPAFRFTDAEEGIAYAFATTGEPYLLRVSSGEEGSELALDFTEYGAPVTVTPPPAEEIVKLPATPTPTPEPGSLPQPNP